MTTGKNKQKIPLSGLRLIEASAGTGKTYKITELFLRLILEKELSVDQILVVTYTDAATEELRDRIRSDLTSARLAEAQNVLRRGLMDVLIERTPFEVPPGLVANELERQLGAARRRLQGSVPEQALHAQLERWKEDWRERAEREVREGLLLEAVAAAEAISVTDEEVEQRIEEVAQGQGTDAEALRSAVGRDNLQRALRAQLVDERALDFLVREAKVEETTDS